LNSKIAVRGALASLVLVLLLGGNVAFASTSTQALAINTGGTVLTAGDQKYVVHGGSLVKGTILGKTLLASASPTFVTDDATPLTLNYNLQADVSGLSASGSAQFQMSGKTVNGMKVVVQGQAQIVGMQSQSLPIGCTTTCTSGIPVFFVGVATTDITIGWSPTQHNTSTMLFESPYFNPWGNPIMIVSTDGAIVIATTYDKATLDWKGTTVSGTIQGSLGSYPVQGTMSLTSNEHEDFVTGVTTYDNGTMSFTNMSPRSLNVQGPYQGTSTIPKPGSFACAAVQWLYSTPCTQDCSAYFGSLGLPVIPGTCTQTGFQSLGKFSLQGQGTSDGGTQTTVTGSYSTTWSSPALGFLSAAYATVTQ